MTTVIRCELTGIRALFFILFRFTRSSVHLCMRVSNGDGSFQLSSRLDCDLTSTIGFGLDFHRSLAWCKPDQTGVHSYVHRINMNRFDNCVYDRNAQKHCLLSYHSCSCVLHCEFYCGKMCPSNELLVCVCSNMVSISYGHWIINGSLNTVFNVIFPLETKIRLVLEH